MIFAPALFTIRVYRWKLNSDFNLDLQAQENPQSDNIPLEAYRSGFTGLVDDRPGSPLYLFRTTRRSTRLSLMDI